ncbi:MAG: glycosyltransferase family 4 protein [Burkholderiales bacterium]|nr:glycosyltransferase family 4 protein [Burkholderiales bacterium]
MTAPSPAAPLYVNGRFLSQSITGVQRFAQETVTALDRLRHSGAIARDRRVVLLVPPDAQRRLALDTIEVRQVGRRTGHAWEQFELPRHARDGLLLGLCQLGPAVLRDQIVVMHDAAVYAAPHGFSRAFRTWYRALMWWLGRRARRIVTVSRFSQTELQRWCGIRASATLVVHEAGEHILAQPADASVLAKHGLDATPFVLAVSSLNPNKNFRAVVDAMRLLGDTTGFRIVIAGGTHPRVFGGDAALPDSVTHVGYVTDPQLRALYEAASCFVYPSFYEGFGLPPLEAMLCGCPVIVSRAASLPEVCGDAALYCDAADPRTLADAMRSIMGDAALRARLTEAGQARARTFSWERCATELWNHVDATR